MLIKLNARFVISFISLVFMMNEAHELVHTITGRIICSCWGNRDFNVWDLCEGCIEQHPSALLATFAGPLFTFIMIWIGAIYLRKDKTLKKKAIGFSLIFANMPFARLFQPLTGGGDELWGFNHAVHHLPFAKFIVFVSIVLVTVIPLSKAYSLIQNKGRLFYFAGFLLVPVLIDQMIILGVMNSLLQTGLLNQTWILGSPMLITLWTLFILCIFLFTGKNIKTLFQPKG